MENSEDTLMRLAAKIESHRNADPVKSYVATLFAKGDDAIIKKIGEEATEAVMAAKDGDKMRIKSELADLWFHCLVLLARHGMGPRDVLAELEQREGISGIDEKASRAGVRGAGTLTRLPRAFPQPSWMTAYSARSCVARFPRRRSTRTTRCSPFTTSIPRRRCISC